MFDATNSTCSPGFNINQFSINTYGTVVPNYLVFYGNLLVIVIVLTSTVLKFKTAIQSNILEGA